LAGGEFNLKPFHEPSERTISSSWEFLLMEAARRRDEASEAAPPAPGVEAKASVAAPAPAASKVVPFPVPDSRFFAKEETHQIPGDLRPETAEMIVCSVQGDVIYEWQCPDSSARVNFLEFLSQKARQIGVGLSFGTFERFEIMSPRSRVVAQVQGEHAIIVRTNLLPYTEAA